MEVKDYCKNMIVELTGWKAKMYDIVRKLDKLPSGEKEKYLPTLNELHIFIEELNERINNLEKACPTEWKADEEEIDRRTTALKSKMKEIWDPLHIGK